MTLRRFVVAALAIVLHTSLMAALIATEAQDPRWIVAQVATTVLTLTVMFWAAGLLPKRVA